MKNNNSNQSTFDNMPMMVAKVYEVVISLSGQMAELKSKFVPKTPDEWLNRQEVADLLRCDLSTVHNWTSKGKLKKYCFGNRPLYKRSEVEASIKPIKIIEG